MCHLRMMSVHLEIYRSELRKAELQSPRNIRHNGLYADLVQINKRRLPARYTNRIKSYVAPGTFVGIDPLVRFNFCAE